MTTKNVITEDDLGLGFQKSAQGKLLTAVRVQGDNINIDVSTGVISQTDTVYTHPTTAGNKHIPAGGSQGNVLRYDSDGQQKWDSLTKSDINLSNVLNVDTTDSDNINNNSQNVSGNSVSDALDNLYNEIIDNNSGLQSQLNDKFDKSSVKQGTGNSSTDVMSQDAASKNFLIDANNTSQRKVFVQNGSPSGMNVGDIWIKI